MTVISFVKLHPLRLPQDVKNAVEVLIAYVELNADQREHKMSVGDFRRLLLVPLATPDKYVLKLVLKMSKGHLEKPTQPWHHSGSTLLT